MDNPDPRPSVALEGHGEMVPVVGVTRNLLPRREDKITHHPILPETAGAKNDAFQDARSQRRGVEQRESVQRSGVNLFGELFRRRGIQVADRGVAWS